MFNKNIALALGTVLAFGLVQNVCCMEDKGDSNKSGKITFVLPEANQAATNPENPIKTDQTASNDEGTTVSHESGISRTMSNSPTSTKAAFLRNAVSPKKSTNHKHRVKRTVSQSGTLNNNSNNEE